MSEPTLLRGNSQVVNDDTNLKQLLHAATIISDTESVSARMKKTGNSTAVPN